MSVYSDYEYRKRTAALKRQSKRLNTPCALCGRPFDFDLPHTDPMAFTADHIESLGNGGHLLGPLRPAHRSCNSRRGKGRKVTPIKPTKKTRNWYG